MMQNAASTSFQNRKFIEKRNRPNFFNRRNILPWLILLPGILLFTFYIWYPMLNGIYLSFFETKGFKPIEFIGLENYMNLFKDKLFYKALTNSFTYVFWSLLSGFAVPVVLAIVVNEVVHFKGLIRVGLYFPNMVPLIAALMLWKFMMAPGKGGFFNSLIALAGLPSFGWLQESSWTIPLIVLMATWRGAGGTALIYVASLQGVSPDLYEAASLDGAGVWQKIRHITLPGIYNMSRLMLILQVIFVFQILYEPLVTTSGGPVNASLSLMLLNYNFAFQDLRIGMASTVGVIVSCILVLLSFVYLKFSKENEMS